MKATYLFAALALVATPAYAQAPEKAAPVPERTGPTPDMPGQMPIKTATDTGPPPAEVLTKLNHANQMEIEAGKLAEKKGDSKAVKDFGKTLVRDHSAANKQVVALAKQMKVDLPKDMPAMKDSKLEKARTLSGPEFDRTFAEAMLEDHKEDIAETTEARDKTTDPQLKKLLTDLVPKLEKHREIAQNIVESGNGKGKEPSAPTTSPPAR